MSQLQLVLFSLCLVILILLAAFFSCAETSLMALNRYRLRHQARLKQRYAIRLLNMLKRPDRLLGAILIGNTFANMVASSLATLLAVQFWGDVGALLVAILLTFIVLIFAEIAPKTLAALYPDVIARWMALPVQWVLKVLYPAVWVANAITNGLLSLFSVKVTNQMAEPLSREELRSLVYDTAGKMSRQYQTMLLGILDLNKLTVDDVMVPKHEIIGINIEQSWEDTLKQMQKTKQEWMPIYRHHLDQVIGVLYLQDVAKQLLQSTNFNIDALLQLLHEPYFVPEGTPLSVQLNYFQQSAEKVAFVVDEYGEMRGLLTMTDILEEIVGDFTTSIANGKRIESQPDGSYLADGACTIREFNRATQFELPVSGPRTLNGLLIEHLEALPHIGTTVLIANYPIEIIQVKENRVKLARVFQRRTS